MIFGHPGGTNPSENVARLPGEGGDIVKIVTHRPPSGG